MRARPGLLVVLLVWLAGCTPAGPPPDAPAPLILVSLDGWRWDYETLVPLPNLESLVARGVRAEALIPSFPSKTFPNHYTAVTGLYPAHHGIVANNILDPETGRRFSLSNGGPSEAMWWGGEPVWVSVERAGRVAASMFWPGSEAAIDGIRPSYWEPYDESLPGEARVDQVLAWLDLPEEERPFFTTLYFEEVDSAGHAFGPDSPELVEALERVDGYLGRLLDGLDARGLAGAVNVVVMSDHGMSAGDPSRVIVLDDYVALDDDEVVDLNPTVGLWPAPGRVDEVYEALRDAHPRLRVYRREETPAHWEYRDHPRIPPIVGVADDGWQVIRRSAYTAFVAACVDGCGQHGYDPAVPSMHALFVAAGPAFRAGAIVPAFGTVDVYDTVMAALGLEPVPNDGDPAVANQLLRPVVAVR